LGAFVILTNFTLLYLYNNGNDTIFQKWYNDNRFNRFTETEFLNFGVRDEKISIFDFGIASCAHIAFCRM
jgi:hypothetical protein